MATQTIRVCVPLAAGPYTANVQTDGSNTDAFSARPVTATANPLFWEFTVTAATAGLYAFQILNDLATVVAYGWFWSDVDTVVTIQDSNSRDSAIAFQQINAVQADALLAKYAAVVILGTCTNADTTDPSYTYDGVTVTYSDALVDGSRTGAVITP